MSVSQEIINVLDALCEKLEMVINWTAETDLFICESLGKVFKEIEV